MAPRRKRKGAARSWRKGQSPERSVLTKGRRTSSRRPDRFSPLHLPPKQVQPSPLEQIPTLRPWLAARETLAAAHAC